MDGGVREKSEAVEYPDTVLKPSGGVSKIDLLSETSKEWER